MSPSSLWVILAVVAAVIEILSPAFGYIFVSAAALLAALGAALGLHLAGQLVLFIATLLVSLLVLRPRLIQSRGRARGFEAQGIPSRTERLIGQRAQVTEPLDPTLGTGRILVSGEDWAARSGEAISAGTEVIVDGADGIVLTVSLP